MSKWRPRACKDCGAVKSEAVHVSARGLCIDCGVRRQLAAAAASIGVGEQARQAYQTAHAELPRQDVPRGVVDAPKRRRFRRPKVAS